MTHIFCETLEQAGEAAAERLAWREEYYELVAEFLTNDIQQDTPAVLAQHKRMDELRALLGEEAAEQIWAAADEAALKNGYYASGAPYPF